MQIEHEIQNGNLAIITLKLDKTEVESRYQKDIKEVAKKTQMPGFRPGNTPKNLIEQKYGAAVRFDGLNQMVNEYLNEYLDTQKFIYYGMPMSVTDTGQKPLADSTTLDFKFELGLRPAVELNIDPSTVFDRYKVSASDEEVDKELELLQRRHGQLTDADTTEEKDMVNGDFVECNADGTVFENGMNAAEKSILISSIKDKDEQSKFIGKKIDDTFHFDIFKAFNDDYTEIAQIFGVAKEAAKDLNASFSFTIKKIQRLAPAALDNELFMKYHSEEHPVTSTDDLKAKIRKDIEDYYASQAEGMLEDDMIKKLVKTHHIKLPDAFLLKWIKQQNKEKNEHEIEHDYLHEKEYLKWSIIRDLVFERENYAVTDEEIENQYQRMLTNYIRRFGYDPYQPMIRNEFESKYFKREEQEESMVNMLKTAKALAYIKQQVIINEVPMDDKKFNEINLERSKHAHDHHHEDED